MVIVEEYSSVDLRDLLLKFGLVKVRMNRQLTIDEFEDIASRLGKPLVTDKHVLNDNRTVQELSNNGLFGDGDVDWHHDWSYGRGNYLSLIHI